MAYLNNVSVVFVSFFSDAIIEKSIKQINSKIKIYIVEQSRNFKLKKHLEKKYKNVEVIIPKENKGNGAGINLGIKKSKTKYVFYLDLDVKIKKNIFKIMYDKAENIKEFALLAPKIKNYIYKKYLYEKKTIFDFQQMNFVVGCALFFNKKILKKVGYFDENIFLYYEENDFYKRCLKKNLPIYLVNSAEIEHVGNSSTDKKFYKEIEINRNWHLMWSSFYFHRKHYGILTAYKKTFFKYLSAVFKTIYYKLLFNDFKKEVYFARASGIFNAIIKNKSWHRPGIKQ